MSRASDIRTYIIFKQPLMTIDQLYVLVAQLHASVESLIALRQNNEKPPMTVTVENVSLELRGNKLHAKEGFVFSPSSLETFCSTLFIMKGDMGLGYRTFATLDINLHRELLLACANVEEDVAKINAEIFSGLLKRYHNRSRAGANNNYQFKYKLSTCKDRFITFELKNMVFDDNDHVDFDIEVNDIFLSEALNGHYRYPMPTGKVASQRLSEKLQSAFIEIPQADNYPSFIAGLKKYGMELNEIYELLDVYVAWHRSRQLTGTVVCLDKVSGIFNVTFGRAEPRWDEVSVSVMDENKVTIIGTKFTGVELAGIHIKEFLSRHRVPIVIPDVFATAALILDREEKAVYHNLLDQEIVTDTVNFDAKAASAERRMIMVDPVIHRGSGDVLFRPYAISGLGSITTLGLVSHKEATENNKTIKVLMDSIQNDKREVDWGNVITPKVGFWAKVKRLFKAA